MARTQVRRRPADHQGAMTNHAQLLFPFPSVPLPQVPLALAWFHILDILRSATMRFSWYDRDVAHAAGRAIQPASWAARRGVPGMVARVRVLRAIRGPIAALPLP